MARGNSRLGIKQLGLAGKGRSRRMDAFAREEDGAMFILALFLFATLLIFSGLSIDLMRYELQRTRLQSTLDRSLLAAAHPDQENDRKGVVLDYFNRAGLSNIVEEEDVHVEVGPDGTIVRASAIMKVGTPFLSWSGVDYLSAPASGGAAKINQLTEISLVVDVSGSMANLSTSGDTKLEELQKAALEFSNLLLCNPNDSSKSTDCTIDTKKTSLSLVPYSSQVTVGQNLLSKFNVQDAQSDSYCATFTDADFKNAGIDPLQPLRQSAKYYTYGQSYINNRYWMNPYGWAEPTNANSEWYDTLWSCYTANWREITPFEDSPTDMESRINALDALGGTAIHVGMKWGSALLRHEIQPAVSSLVSDGVVHSAFNGRPYDSNSVASSKFLVLMTDGINSNVHRLKDGYRTGPSPFWYNSETGILSVLNMNDVDDPNDDTYYWFDPKETAYSGTGVPQGTWQDHPFGDDGNGECHVNRHGTNKCTPNVAPASSYTSRLTYEQYWKKGYTWRIFESFPHLGEAGVFTANHTGYEGSGHSADDDLDGIRNVDDLLLDQCNAAKNAGITIYTIEMETPDTTTSVMSSCASIKENERLYYKVTGLDIASVFSKIAADINKLRLTH